MKETDKANGSELTRGKKRKTINKENKTNMKKKLSDSDKKKANWLVMEVQRNELNLLKK